MPGRTYSAFSTASSGGGCERSCASRTGGRRWDAAKQTICDGPMPSSRIRGCSPCLRLMKTRDTPDEENQRLESRVRENRTHGSEGGEVKAFPTPIWGWGGAMTTGSRCYGGG